MPDGMTAMDIEANSPLDTLGAGAAVSRRDDKAEARRYGWGCVSQAGFEHKNGTTKSLLRCRRQDEVLQRVCRQGFTGCILAAPAVEPTALVQGVLPLLASSASLAAFGPALQPLAECMHVLKVQRPIFAQQAPVSKLIICQLCEE